MSKRLQGTFTDHDVQQIESLAACRNISTSEALQIGMRYFLEHSEDRWLFEEANKIDRATEEYTAWEDR